MFVRISDVQSCSIHIRGTYAEVVCERGQGNRHLSGSVLDPHQALKRWVGDGPGGDLACTSGLGAALELLGPACDDIVVAGDGVGGLGGGGWRWAVIVLGGGGRREGVIVLGGRSGAGFVVLCSSGEGLVVRAVTRSRGAVSRGIGVLKGQVHGSTTSSKDYFQRVENTITSDIADTARMTGKGVQPAQMLRAPAQHHPGGDLATLTKAADTTVL